MGKEPPGGILGALLEVLHELLASELRLAHDHSYPITIVFVN